MSLPKLPKEKARYWAGILYPENMRDGWEDDIGHLLQVPYAYCVHDADLQSTGEERKPHVHVMICYSNTTTARAAYMVLDRLSKEDFHCLSTVESVNSVRHMYEYLIHNTEDCRKKGKHQYEPASRITGNNFDIGCFEQISQADKANMCKELCDMIIEQQITNFADFYLFVMTNYDMAYFDILKTYSGLFERILKGVYLKAMDTQKR